MKHGSPRPSNNSIQCTSTPCRAGSIPSAATHTSNGSLAFISKAFRQAHKRHTRANHRHAVAATRPQCSAFIMRGASNPPSVGAKQKVLNETPACASANNPVDSTQVRQGLKQEHWCQPPLSIYRCPSAMYRRTRDLNANVLWTRRYTFETRNRHANYETTPIGPRTLSYVPGDNHHSAHVYNRARQTQSKWALQ